MRIYSIAGNVVTVQKNTLNYNDKLNERTTCSFIVVEPIFDIDVGMEVIVTDDAVNVFSGTIDNVTEQGDVIKYVSVSCVDFSQLIDKRIIADAFEGELAGDIVKEFITKVFSQEGITEGIVQDGLVISKAVFNYNNGNVAMNYLADVTGFNWFIDKDKQLNFFDRSTYSAPFSLTDSSAYNNLQVKKNRGQYRNRQYVRAGTDVTQEIVKEKPSPKPDGVSRTFVARLPVAQKPRIYINDVEISANDIGVNGIDKNKKYYFTYNSNAITQDQAVTLLADTDKLEITYKGLYPLLVVSDNAEEINARKTLEGGSGIYENIEQEPNINTKETAFEFVQGKLAKYGIISKTVTFNIYETGLKAGQLLSIQNTKHNLNDSFLIESVTARDDNGLTLYTVKCLDGSSLGGWEQFFKNLIQGQKKLVIRENEVLVLLNTAFEKQNWSEQLQDAVYACPLPHEELYPSETLYPC